MYSLQKTVCKRIHIKRCVMYLPITFCRTQELLTTQFCRVATTVFNDPTRTTNGNNPAAFYFQLNIIL